MVSCKIFGSLGHYPWKLSYKWATWRRNKPRRWIVGQYFGKFSKFRNDRWVFGDRESGAYLVKFSWTAIRRHVRSRARHPPMTVRNDHGQSAAVAALFFTASATGKAHGYRPWGESTSLI